MKNCTVRIEGLMCPKCEAKVESALLAVAGVLDAEADHDAGTACVSCEDGVELDALAAAVEGAGYRAVSAELS